jgi:putative transposase
MAAPRSLVFCNDHWYHVFNRGIEGRRLFLVQRDYQRFLSTLYYYQFYDVPMRYSYYLQLAPEFQKGVMQSLETHAKRVTIASYCLMPNHFHFLIRQNTDDGISRYIADASNSFSKYFNTKNSRIGTLFQGVFKAVHIESDEQMLHVSRYIHCNPHVSSLCDYESVFQYPWSSLSSYVEGTEDALIDKTYILGHFSGKTTYREFIEDKLSFQRKNVELQHVLLE